MSSLRAPTVPPDIGFLSPFIPSPPKSDASYALNRRLALVESPNRPATAPAVGMIEHRSPARPVNQIMLPELGGLQALPRRLTAFTCVWQTRCRSRARAPTISGRVAMVRNVNKIASAYRVFRRPHVCWSPRAVSKEILGVCPGRSQKGWNARVNGRLTRVRRRRRMRICSIRMKIHFAKSLGSCHRHLEQNNPDAPLVQSPRESSRSLERLFRGQFPLRLIMRTLRLAQNKKACWLSLAGFLLVTRQRSTPHFVRPANYLSPFRNGCWWINPFDFPAASRQ